MVFIAPINVFILIYCIVNRSSDMNFAFTDFFNFVEFELFFVEFE